MDFASFIAPLDPAEFDARYFNKAPVVIRADDGARRAELLDWPRLNAMLQIRPHWTPERIKLVLNSRPIAPDHYMETVNGRLIAAPARLEAMLAIGASLVAEMVEEIDPSIANVTDMLSERYAARAGANIYASFQGVQAFASHCDTHDVFALQCAGAKRWRIYANRADNPLDTLKGESAQAQIDAAKGAVMMEITLNPGDLLYLPRGFFHDAIATDTASLHLTIGVAPYSGMLLIELIDHLARADSAFRAYLPDARDAGGATLAKALGELGHKLSQFAASAGMAEQIACRQRMLRRPVHPMALPERPKVTRFARTELRAQVVERLDGAILVTENGVQPIGILADVAEYIVSRPGITREEVAGRFAHHSAAEIEALLRRMVGVRLIEQY